MIQKIPVDTSSSLQESQSVSTSVQNWVISIATLEPQAFLISNMDEVTTDTSKKPSNIYPWIKPIIFVCIVKDIGLDIMISLGITSSFEFFLRLPQHSWDSVLDDIELISSPAKTFHSPCSLRESPKNNF